MLLTQLGGQNSKGIGKGQSSLGLLELQSPPSFLLIKKSEALWDV